MGQTDLRRAHAGCCVSQAPSAADEPIAAVHWPGHVVGEDTRPAVDVLQAVLSALDRDGVCMIRNALPADIPRSIHQQMEPHLAARAETVGLSKQTAGESGRQAGSVLSRSQASWDAALHPLIMELCAGVIGRQVALRLLFYFHL